MKHLRDLWEAFPQTKFQYEILRNPETGFPIPSSISLQYDGDLAFFLSLAMLACSPIILCTIALLRRTRRV